MKEKNFSVIGRRNWKELWSIVIEVLWLKELNCDWRNLIVPFTFSSFRRLVDIIVKKYANLKQYITVFHIDTADRKMSARFMFNNPKKH